jgi:hypothetical protein
MFFNKVINNKTKLSFNINNASNKTSYTVITNSYY